MLFKNVVFVAKTCKYGIFVAKMCKYGIFVAKIYKYALIDRFQGSAGSLDSAANCAALQYLLVFVFVPLKGCQMPIGADPFDMKLDFYNPPHLNACMWARPYQKVPHMAATF